MPAAAAVADPLGSFEFQVGDRWFDAAPHVHPDVLIGVMRRAQNPPTDPTDPAIGDWLTTVIGFLMVAVVPDQQDGLVATLTGLAGTDPDGAAVEVAQVFGDLLALFTARQLAEVRAAVVAHEKARTAINPFPTKETPVIRRRSTVADIERITRKHGRRATGEVIDPGV